MTTLSTIPTSKSLPYGVIYTNDCSGDKFIVRRCTDSSDAYGWLDYYVRDGQYHDQDLSVAKF